MCLVFLRYRQTSWRRFIFFFMQKPAYELRISVWSSDVCSSDLSYHVLTGPALELTRLRRDAVEDMGRAAEAAASNDHQAAYDALSGFLARVTGRQATHENAAENAAEDAVDHGTDGLDPAAPLNSDTAEAQPAPAERVADADGGGPGPSAAD